MRQFWAPPAITLTCLLSLQACGSPEGDAFAIQLASTLAGKVAQEWLKEGPPHVGSTTPPSTHGGSSNPGPTAAATPKALPSLAPGLPDGTPTTEEGELLSLLTKYRQSKGLPAIPTSRSLSIVAQAHAADLNSHPNDSSAGCNMHSWSSQGPWTAMCYTSDHAQAKAMWGKPQELGTGYPGHGYEIAHGGPRASITPQSALNAWIGSHPHHQVMINGEKWKDNVWQAVGAGMKGGYAVIWFGEEVDPRP